MKLYSEGTHYKLYHGSMLDLLEVVQPNSIDSVVTDPPYELNFMGKGWDNSGIAFQKETWEKCFTALKPGGYLLAFGGTRTYHRIACAIEDAGFEIRDTIMWLYGCYSADTQVLTDKGWKYFYDLDRTERILQWDKDTNALSWCKPLNYFEYDVDDELCLFENRHISQLVTKNHKVACQIKARRKTFSEYQLVEAQDIKPSWILNFPLAGELGGTIHEDDAYILGWWLTDAWSHSDGKAIMFSQSKPKTLDKLRGYLDSHNIKYSEYIKQSKSEKHRDEHIFYVTGDIADKMLSLYPNRKLTWDMLNWDMESRKALLAGLMDGDGSYRSGQYAMTFWSMDAERLDIFQALCISLNYRAYVHKDSKWCVEFNVNHNTTQVQTRHHKPNVAYTGKVYCLQTETGAFVVRRNGKAFISGNSGFPKSMNIGLAIDKKNGVESAIGDIKPGHSEFVNRTTDGHMRFDGGMDGFDRPWMHDEEKRELYHYQKIPTSDSAKQWDGWGTALKPAYEPVIVARKPCEGSCIDNVLKYGVGGINIDDCRIPTTDYLYNHGNSNGTINSVSVGNFGPATKGENRSTELGRFPSNVILTYDETDQEEVCGGMPDTDPARPQYRESVPLDTRDAGWRFKRSSCNISDSGGSAARYFYCAKASNRDREEGCDSLPDKQRFQQGNYSQSPVCSVCGKTFNGTNDHSLCGENTMVYQTKEENTSRKNIHPTVKPTDLMQYLVRLVTPKGGIVLDPFNGSGSTGKAVAYENQDRTSGYSYIGIELSEEYLDISDARIKYVENMPVQFKLF